MKKNFKKSLAVFMAMLMLLSVVSVSAIAASYTLTFAAGNHGIEKDVTFKITGEKGSIITLPGVTYTREGYVQIGWTTSKSSSGSTTSSTYLGDVGESYKIDKNRSVYPYWKVLSFDVTFAPGADGVGVAQSDEVDFGKTTNFPGAIFTREGYIQSGWTTVEGGEHEYNVTGKTPKIEGDTTFYPVWTKCDYSVETDVSYMNFGNVCVNYSAPAAQLITVTNVGNMLLEYTLPTDANYDISLVSGSLPLKADAAITIKVQPKSALAAGNYSATFVLDCVYDQSDVTFRTNFIVNEHSFDKYHSDNNATYEADGTKSAECSNGCGTTDTIIDIGSMKKYSADNNTVEGLLDEYLYHKTIRVTAYGSGTDNIQADGTIAEGTKRFLPVSWYVNDEFNGEFKSDNYDINYVHTDYGKFTLKVNYVEQEYVNGEWVDTGVEDEKSFDYYVGPSEKDKQEIERPNMIVSIIFGLFAKIAELFGGLFG